MNFFSRFFSRKKKETPVVDDMGMSGIAQPSEGNIKTQSANIFDYPQSPFGFTGAKFSGAMVRDLYNPDLLNRQDLRHFSSQFYYSNSLAHNIIDTKSTTIINRGLMLEAKPMSNVLEDMGITVPEDWSRKVEQRFDLWAGSKGADYNFNTTFYQQQALGFEHYLLKGKVIYIARFISAPRRGRLGRLNLQLMHVDQLITPFDEKARHQKNGGDVIDGMHIDSSGTIVGAYFLKRLTGSTFSVQDINNWVYIPRWGTRTNRMNLIMSINQSVPNDVEGMPDLTPVLHDLNKLEEFSISELQAAAVNAAIALIQNSDGKQPNSSMLGKRVGTRTTQVTDSDGNDVDRVMQQFLAPGVHMYASQPGQKLESFDTRRPNVNFKDFFETFIIKISSARGIPQEILFKKFSNNFSASRAALLEFWRYVIRSRHSWASDICQPVYELWLPDEILFGRVEADGFFNEDLTMQTIIRKAWSYAEWPGIAKGSIDLKKEVDAAAIAEDRNWTTAESNSRELYGKNFDTNVDRRKQEEAMRGSVSEEELQEEDVFDDIDEELELQTMQVGV
jgi:capsid protein